MAHQIDESKPKYLSQTRFMSGRRIIKTSVTEITDENVVDVLRKALATHELNRSEIDYLWKYYRGDQPIRNRVKDVRPEICNKITENRANEIVSFKVGYLCGEPIQYVSRNGGEEIVKQINTLNEYIQSIKGGNEMYTITLANGKKLTGLDMNGTNYVSKEKVDETIFKDNLSTMKVSDGETETIYTDMVFIQQMEWADGTFYLAFREKTKEEKLVAALNATSNSITDVQVALAEVYEMVLGGN